MQTASLCFRDRASKTMMLAALCLAVAAVHPLTAHAVLVDQESNDFDVVAPVGVDETFLISQVHRSAGVARIRSVLRTSAPDRNIKIHWTDHKGATILEYEAIGIHFKSWISLDSQWVGAFSQPRYAIFAGDADFTGFQRDKFPCLDGTKCPSTHLDWTSNGPTGGGGGAQPAVVGSFASIASAASTPPAIRPLSGDFAGVNETRAGLASLIEDPTAPDDPELATRLDLAGFVSSVESIAGGYRYRYTATNQTGTAAEFDFNAHGFTGILEPGESESFELVSADAPGLLRVAPHMGAADPLRVDARMVSAALSMDVLTPVPEPTQALLLLAGLAMIVGRVVRRQPRRSYSDSNSD